MRRHLVTPMITVTFVLAITCPALAGFTFTTIDVPGAATTEAFGINGIGQIVGDYATAAGPTHGFLQSGGTFTTIDVPGASFTRSFGINGSGQIVGVFSDTGGMFHGYLLSGGTFTTFDVPGASFTTAVGINGAGQIVGFFENASGFHGYLRSPSGMFTTIDVPGASATTAQGINGLGQIVGDFDNSTGTHAFRLSGGTFTPIDVPGADFTSASGINQAGQIVGGFCVVEGNICGLAANPTEHGFLLSGGAFTQIDFPGAFDTDASGINDVGQIVGSFATGPLLGLHGFVATPAAVSEPSTLLLLGPGVAVLASAAWRRARRT